MKTIILKLIWVGLIFNLNFSKILFSENISLKEFILQGIKYQTSLIQDASCKWQIIHDRYKKECEWKFKSLKGKEYLKIRSFQSDGQTLTEIFIDYLQQKGMIIRSFSKELSFSTTPEARIIYGDEVFTVSNKSLINGVPPTSLFCLLWPGVKIDEILSDKNTEILEQKEIINGEECFVIKLNKFSRFNVEKFEQLKSSNKPNEEFMKMWRYGSKYKIWVSPTKGFLPVKIEISPVGKDRPFCVFEINLDRFDENVWFPKRVNIYFPISKNSEPIKVNYTDIKINYGIKDEEFEPILKPGTKIFDEASGVEFIFEK